jgi:hypothetical protein
MNSSSSTVSAELGLRLIVPQQTIVPLVASLFYSGDDPYAIRIAFHVGLDEPVEWIFARDLLAEGIKDRTGLGDVQVWPSAATVDPASDETGQQVNEISDFLRRTYRIVEAGQEGEHVDVESELDDLLRQA